MPSGGKQAAMFCRLCRVTASRRECRGGKNRPLVIQFAAPVRHGLMSYGDQLSELSQYSHALTGPTEKGGAEK